MDNLESLFDKIDATSLKEMWEGSIFPILVTNSDWDNGIKILYVNKAFCNATGYKSKELLGKNPKILQGEKSNFELLKELKTELLKGNKFVGQTINYKKDRTTYHVKWSIVPIKDKDKNIIGYISYQNIIDTGIQLENKKLLSSIVNISKNLILVTDLEGFIVFINDSFSKKLGYEKDELVGRHTRVLKSGLQDKKFYQTMWKKLLTKGTFSSVFISKKKDGSLFYDKKDINTIKDDDGNPVYYVSISQDITKEVEKQKSLELQIYKDGLTGLNNRKKYDQIIEEKVEKYTYDKSPFSLILIDIDHFKNINDTYGHDMGDYVLQKFAKILKMNLRSDDTLFRWGGEEFALLVNKNKEESFTIADKLRAIIAQSDFQTINITASFGISQMDNTMQQDTLFAKADVALYEAKKSGRNKVVMAT